VGDRLGEGSGNFEKHFKFELMSFYTRKQLDDLSTRDNFGSEEFHNAVQLLFQKLSDQENLTISEEYFICNIIDTSKPLGNAPEISSRNIINCNNYNFRTVYLLYWFDVNGHSKYLDYYGEIEKNQVQTDVTYLENEFRIWEAELNKKHNGTEIIDFLARETLRQLNQSAKYCKNNQIGYFKQQYFHKSLILHSKFIFLIVTKYYQEIGRNREEIDFFGKTILLNCFSYIHILFRHFSAKVKEHQFDKTYHFDNNIDPDILPEFLSWIIEIYKVNLNFKDFDLSIKFRFKNAYYVIYFKEISESVKGSKIIEYYRLETFYPIKKSDLEYQTEISVSDELAFFVK